MFTKNIASMAIACALGCSMPSALDAEEQNILVLGNSYSFGTFNHLPHIAAAMGDKANVLCLRGPFLEAIERELSGEPLIPMAEAEQLGHGESNDAGYVLIQSDTKKRALLAETLRTGDWDVVTMQSGSGFAQLVHTEDNGSRYPIIAQYVKDLAPAAEWRFRSLCGGNFDPIRVCCMAVQLMYVPMDRPRRRRRSP